MATSEPTPTTTSQSVPDYVPAEELGAHRGRWLAFSGDGSRLIASASSLANLEAKLRKAGEDAEEVLLEWTPNGDSIISGSELS
jgi:hypothetical protein